MSELSAAGRGAALNLLGFSFSLGAVAAPLLMSFASGRFSTSTILYLLVAAPAAVLVLILTLRFPRAVHAATPIRSLVRVLNHPVVWRGNIASLPADPNFTESLFDLSISDDHRAYVALYAGALGHEAAKPVLVSAMSQGGLVAAAANTAIRMLDEKTFTFAPPANDVLL